MINEKLNQTVEDIIAKAEYNPKSQTVNYTLAIIMGGLIFLSFVLPLVFGGSTNLDYFTFTITFIAIFAGLSLSLNMEVGFLGLPNFGKIGFIAVGAYSYILFVNSGVNEILSFIFAGISAGVFGIILTLPSLRLKEDYFAIVTIVVGEIIRETVRNQHQLGGFEGFAVPLPIDRLYPSNTTFLQNILLNNNSISIILITLILIFLYFIYLNQKYSKIYAVPYSISEPFVTKGGIQEEVENGLINFTIFLGIIVIVLNFFGSFGGSPNGAIDLSILILLILLFFQRNYKFALLRKYDIHWDFLKTIIVFMLYIIFSYVLGFVFPVNSLSTTLSNWYNMLLAVGVLLISYKLIEDIVKSPFGRTMRAFRDDDTSAISVGKSLLGYRIKGLALSNMFAGFFGVLLAYQVGSITPDGYTPTTTFTLYIMIIVGGTANNIGAIFGAFLIQLLFQAASKMGDLQNVGGIFAGLRFDFVNFSLIVVGVVLILFLIFAPEGIFPEQKNQNERYLKLLKQLSLDTEGSKSYLVRILSFFMSIAGDNSFRHQNLRGLEFTENTDEKSSNYEEEMK